MDQPKLPRIYLVKRDAVTDEAVQHALRITPVKGVLAVHPDDLKAVQENWSLGELAPSYTTTDGWGPMVIVAEGFDHPLAVINEDGKVEVLCPAPTPSNQ